MTFFHETLIIFVRSADQSHDICPFFSFSQPNILVPSKKLKYNWNDATCWDALSCKFCRCSGWHVGRWAREEAFQCSWNGREEIIPFSSFLLISIQSLTSSSSQDKILSQPTTLFLFYKPQRERKILSNYIKLSFISGEMEVKISGCSSNISGASIPTKNPDGDYEIIGSKKRSFSYFSSKKISSWFDLQWKKVLHTMIHKIL